MRLIDADALIADLLTVDPRYTEMVEWCCNVIRQTPTIEPTDTDLISRADATEAVRLETGKLGRGLLGRGDILDIIYALPSAEQVTSKLKKPCDSLLTDGSNGSKEHKSKLDLISRQDVIEALCRSSVYAWSIEQDQTAHDWALNIIKALPSAEAVKVAYICDGRKCDKDCSECFRTLDIEHARDFKRVGDAYYQQESAEAEEYDDYKHATLVDIKEPLKVAVVRCKDCKQRRVEGDCTNYYYCDFLGSICGDNEYCSFGERREP